VRSLIASGNSGAPPAAAPGSGDGAFRQLANEILEYTYKEDPSTATTIRPTSARCSAPQAISKGWAHYCEQMMLDGGLRAGDPTYRLAQVPLALLRDVRFIAGIKMHTQGLTVDQAKEMFVKDAYQSERSRSPRQGVAHPTRCTAIAQWAS
jgi:Bacterial protein of unknown function (DUF885)